MKSIILSIIVCSTASYAFAQDETTSAWSVSPSLTYVRNFQGETTASSAYEGFEANGFSVRARIFNERTKSLALTLSGGVNWFYRPARYLTSQSNGVSSIRANEFTLFPLGAGLHVVFPYRSRDSFMIYGGVDVTLNFISGNIGIKQQVQPGYTLMGGFAIKIFEFGVRYSAFSDIKNLGAHIGLRFKSLEL